MTRKEIFDGVIGYFEDNVPAPQSELNFTSPYELIVSVILSAQCTDKRVNLTTPDLFKAYPTASRLADAEFEDVFELIKSISYPRSKAQHLIGMAQKVTNDFGGEIPSDIDALMTLPGVGRKTANVVAAIIYNKPVIAVDTHIFRVSHRLGLSDGKTPEAVEKDLERHIAEPLRPVAHHWLLLHGRYICTARAPKCSECQLTNWCRSFSIFSSASAPAAPK